MECCTGGGREVAATTPSQLSLSLTAVLDTPIAEAHGLFKGDC